MTALALVTDEMTPDRQRAEARAARIRANVAELVADLVDAWRDRDDEALGFDSFGAYTEWLFGDVSRVSIPVEARRELVVGMSERDGLGVRPIAKALGIGKSQVARDLRDARPVPEPEVVDVEVVADVADSSPVRHRSKRDIAVELVRQRGGLTSLELAALTGWRQGQASGTLADVKRQRRVRATETFRDGYAVHVAAGE